MFLDWCKSQSDAGSPRGGDDEEQMCGDQRTEDDGVGEEEGVGVGAVTEGTIWVTVGTGQHRSACLPGVCAENEGPGEEEGVGVGAATEGMVGTRQNRSACLPRARTVLCDVPTSHPPHLRHVPASKIITDQHATRFLESLQTYLSSLSISFAPRTFDTFHLFSHLVFRLPSILEVSNSKLTNIVRASPPRPRRGRCPPEAAHLDFTLVHSPDRNPYTEGTAIKGEW
ncbi:hypothetical protein JVT61DRAFT_9716 [Boletus reticuloceps]|uniref:Uncharacterized protein n=1 Tax=Boletus reticuloceps TaxID=495285 RepID=A0A8I3A502_9AGAM|nr:hypothetical protein JVT61DRAFT_9716 [Boletus reticuloceps]